MSLPLRIDVHVHLAGTGAASSGCWISPAFERRYTFRLLRWWYGISAARARESIDDEWVDRVADMVRRSELDRAVVLGFDGVYDAAGKFDPVRSQLVVPPTWVFEACRRHPDALLPGPSINPFRKDSLERLDECIEGGAALIKWLPATQAIDPSSPRLRSFYRRMADAGLPLLVHSGGGETTFREVVPHLKDVRLLEVPLRAGVPVICAHSGTPVVFTRDPNQLAVLRSMLERYPHLWLDNSGMANPSRFPYLPRLARDPLFQARTLHGSDFPVPTSALYYVGRVGARAAWRIERERNPLERDVALKRALGYSEQTFTRAEGVLAALERWRSAAPAQIH